MIEPIRKSIEVRCDAAKAFEIFTERTATWWPLETNTVSAMQGAAAQAVTIEPRVGGRLYETMANGDEMVWGSVRALETGKRIVLSWHIGVPEAQATEVEVRFTPTGAGATRVDLEHRGWEAMEGGEGARDSFASGWVTVFDQRFAAACG